jgi:threonine dehydratase
MSLDAARPPAPSTSPSGSPSGSLPRAADVEEAAQRLAQVVTRTPLETNPRWSAALGAHVRVKREDLQAVRSYKLRGAYNLVAQLSEDERARGVVTASAGNHAQGLAYACAALRVRGRIYVPRTTPRQKRDRIAALGQEFVETIVLGDTYDDSAAAATQDAARSGATLVPAFDDPRTLTGQGTVAVEVFEQLAEFDEDPPDVLVVPVGGGGLLAGVLTWVRERHPQVRIVGVEPEGAPSMAAALAAGHPVRLDTLDTFVDGAPGGTRRRPRGGDLRRDARDVPDRRDHRRTRGRARHGRPGRGRARRTGPERRLRRVRRQQRHQPLRRDHRTRPGARGPQALLPRGVPAGTRRAAPLPRRGPRAGRRHRAVRVREAQQPRVRARPGGDRDPQQGRPPPTFERISAAEPLYRYLL